MITETMTRTTTTDTAEPVTVQVLPADDRTGDGYDWMDALEGTAWSVLPNWGSEGWDAGAWPYIIFAVARTRDGNGELFGYGTYVEGDTSTYWFRSQGRLLRSGHRRGVLPPRIGRDTPQARQHPLTTSLRFSMKFVKLSSVSLSALR